MRDILVGAYGTLRLDQGNYNWLLKDKSDHVGSYVANDFKLIAGTGFPYAVETEDGSGKVLLDLFLVDEHVFKSLDRLEGYPNFYNRKKISTPHGDAWVYFYNQADGGEVISDGDWVKHISNRHERRRFN
jgi:gamma-glutamylcyclotransferase (GGCT)/AIG2-like uncharacterized protein YtfP